ncbi:hypothetical protein D9619_010232 [Psilocybe cf. subviscida]|uniref:Eisosome component PIL1-domain-containing protein n=1 Tax=Psilocybe cf. subviscida TaxID=2480587 RepID=A0A8H5ASP9_9AGAR|nr:hypothetical protein D9619_010232 [Psilocybe cf. subviscida]
MFKTAATKIAHNSTLPSLGGNQDLRPLQDLITAEKAVLISLQKLSVDYSKASEALRTWGLNEGDDLGDILSASTTVMNHFSSALSQYASHGHVMRDQLKAIRTREEALEDLRRRRRSVVKNAEAADKKLSKMGPEHKNLGMQTELLNRLRDEIRTMDSDIMTEEAALGDFKRSATRQWMGLKFGGLLECCEKGTVVAEFGKMLIAEISEDITQPGLPRAAYYGHSKTENYVAEAHRCVNEIQLSTVPSDGPRDRRANAQPQTPQQISYQPGQPDPYTPGSAPFTPIDSKPQPPPPPPSNDFYSQRPYEAPTSPQGPSGPSFAGQQPWTGPQPPYQQNEPSYSQPPSQYAEQQPQQSMDDFGMNTRSAGLTDMSNTAGGRFATFPVKMRAGAGPATSPSVTLPDSSLRLSGHESEDTSFSASIAEALDTATNATNRAPSSRWGGSAFAGNETRSVDARSPPPQIPWTAPSATEAVPLQHPHETLSSPPPPVSTSPLTLPPGAAPPDFSKSWVGGERDGSVQAPSHASVISNLTAKEDALLAYMTSAMEDDEPHSAGLHPSSLEEQQRISRHVRFGETEDVDEEMEKRESLEKERAAAAHPPAQSPPKLDLPVDQEEDYKIDLSTPVGKKESEDPSVSDGKPKNHRVPPPTFEPEADEKALDAAAARQISLELEGLPSSPPSTVEPDQSSPVEPLNVNRSSTAPLNVDRGRLPSTSNAYSDRHNVPVSVAPLQPQAMSYAQRNVSPHPYAEINTNAPAPAPHATQQYSPTNQGYNQPYQGPSPYGPAQNVSPAQAYAQSYQSSHLPKTPDSQVPTSTIPPRFQALNLGMETQIPPRFQRAHSPGSPIGSQLPHRFQTNSAAAQLTPGPISAEPQDMSRLTAMQQGSETPFRTPPEYPSRLGSSPSPFARSNPSLAPSGTSPGGARTISAAAFKRPRNASVERLGGGGGAGAQSDPFAKRTLPGSPYSARENTLQSTNLAERPPGAGLAAPPPGAARPKSEFEPEDEYDYISAYVNNSNPNSPQQTQFPTLAPGSGPAQSGPGGYNDGRFATNLEHEGSLR